MLNIMSSIVKAHGTSQYEGKRQIPYVKLLVLTVDSRVPFSTADECVSRDNQRQSCTPQLLLGL